MKKVKPPKKITYKEVFKNHQLLDGFDNIKVIKKMNAENDNCCECGIHIITNKQILIDKTYCYRCFVHLQNEMRRDVCK
jgi:hypothetical protein